MWRRGIRYASSFCQCPHNSSFSLENGKKENTFFCLRVFLQARLRNGSRKKMNGESKKSQDFGRMKYPLTHICIFPAFFADVPSSSSSSFSSLLEIIRHARFSPSPVHPCCKQATQSGKKRNVKKIISHTKSELFKKKYFIIFWLCILRK